MKKILYLHRTRGTGVEGVHIGGMVSGFRSIGHKVTILSPRGWESEILAEQIDKNSVKERLFRLVSRYAPEIIFELLELLANLKLYKDISSAPAGSFDIIYERYSLFGVAGVLAARKRNIPIIHEINYLSTSHLVRRRTRLLQWLSIKMEKYILQESSGFAVVSSPLSNQLIMMGIPEEVIRLTPNAADPDVFNPELYRNIRMNHSMSSDSGKIIIGFIGGFYPWHGIPFLVDALMPLINENPSVNLLLIGDGPDRAAIFEKIKANGMEGRVILPGNIAHDQLPEYLSVMDIGVMPNSNSYGSPMKVFEYMSMGIPVIAPDLPPLRDVIENGLEGFLFQPGNGIEILTLIRRLVDNPELRKQTGQNARTKVIKKNNWNMNAQIVMELISPSSYGALETVV